jgi:iron complex outermembrane receptor protein
MSGSMGRTRRALMLSTCLVGLACVAGGAAAQQVASASTSASTQLQEVIVTAERRETDVQHTPDAVSVVSSRALDEQFINRITGLNAEVPSLEITKASGFENLVAIRGIGSETPENSLTTVPGVSEFIDGVYIANSISLDQTLFDVHDIEVLRGPQGALYGQSSTGGAILINTNQPELGRYSGAGDASFGNYNLYRERLEVNIPIGDTLALRLSGQKYDHTGFTNDVAIPGFKEDDAHDESGKAALLWKPTANFSATLTAQIYHSDQHGDAQKNIDDPESSPWSIYQDYPAHFKLTTQLYHLNLQWDLPWFTIKSVTAYQGLDHVQQEDSSRTAYSLASYYDDVAAWNTHVHNYTEELDFLSKSSGKVDWIAGLFGQYQGSKQYVLEYECTPGYSCYGAPTSADLSASEQIANEGPNFPDNLYYGNLSHITHRSGSIFAQATWHATDALRVTAGIRGNWDYTRDVSFNFASPFLGTPDSSTTINPASVDAVPTWRLEADYDVTPANMVYASYARGYKPGSVNGRSAQVVCSPTVATQCDDVIPADVLPEKNDAFEIGSKNYFLDHQLQLNVAGYYYIQSNFQYIEYSPIPFASGISNIPQIQDYGIEFESQYQSQDGRFHVGGTLALETGHISEPYKSIDSTLANAIETAAPCYSVYNSSCYYTVAQSAIQLQGKQPPDMPNVSGAFNASYRLDAFGGALTPRVQFIYRGREWARIFNDPTLDRVPAYDVVNLSVEYAPANSNLRISLIATNVGDVAGINSRYTDPYGTGQTSNQYIPPRQIIGSIAYSF